MILSSLALENFKQFREPLLLEPSEGAIGVVGTNGSGKTTLFEAILWAFFGSKAGGARFSNDAIPWSGGSVADRSLVEVTLDVGGVAYKVSRSLQRGKAAAYVYDESGAEITGGPNDVSNWVQEKLLEMDRVAFDATFFARQKELAFFAGVEGVRRQREVARILGIDQVEKAQKLLRDDRNFLRSEANALEQILSGTDFEAIEAEHEEQKKLRDTLKARASELRDALDSRTKSLQKVRAEGERLEKLYAEHNRLTAEIGKATSKRDRAAERVVELESRLRGMADDEERITKLEPQSKGLTEVEAGISALEESRRREERLKSTRKEMDRVLREARGALSEAADLVEGMTVRHESPLPGWRAIIRMKDDSERVRKAAEVLEAASPEHDRTVDELERSREVRKRYEALSVLEGRLEKAAGVIEASEADLRGLDDEARSLTDGGDSVDEKLSGLRSRHDGLQRQAAQQRGLAKADDREAANLAEARRMVEESDEHAKCPTCQRGYKEDEHTRVISSIRRQEDFLAVRAEESREECRRLDRESDGVSKEILAAENLRSEVYRLREKRTGLSTRHQSLLEKRNELRGEAGDIRAELSGTPRPSEDEIRDTERSVMVLRELRDARPKLLGLIATHDRSRATAADIGKEVAGLSEGDPYDEARHKELSEGREKIKRARWKIESLREGLKARPEVEAKLEAERESRDVAGEKVAGFEAEIKGLGFSEEAYSGARLAVSEAERLREAAREESGAAENGLRDAEGRISATEKDLDRYSEQRKAADAKMVEASSLGSMDGLFTEFYRELTARVRPSLQREASDLVKTLTDGRYERMEFDENYGVRLYDGLSDAYEISRFSGGEADIVSLCARVALSKMISGKGSGALGFIVLDEVFGALDASRRANVLLALERLKRTFGQIFIISHVADVQESALLDETWFIEEDEEGRSSVRVIQHALPEAAGLPG